MSVDGNASQSDGDLNPEDIQEWIESISIRGRMAYGLLCVESALQSWNISSTELDVVLAVFWEFTSCEDLAAWDRNAQKVQPYFYMPEEEIEEEWDEMADDFGYSELNETRKLALGRMLGYLHGFSNNLFGGFQSQVTAVPLLKIVNVMRDIGLPLPNRSRVSLSSVDEDDGWGRAHPREFFW